MIKEKFEPSTKKPFPIGYIQPEYVTKYLPHAVWELCDGRMSQNEESKLNGEHLPDLLGWPGGPWYILVGYKKEGK